MQSPLMAEIRRTVGGMDRLNELVNSPMAKSKMDARGPYVKRKVIIGNTLPDFDGEDVYLDFTKSKRIAIVSPPGTCKTTLINSIAVQTSNLGIGTVLLNDTKNDTKLTLPYPIQPKFEHLVCPELRGMTARVKAYVPFVINKGDMFQYSPNEYDGYIQYSSDELMSYDLATLAELDGKEHRLIRRLIDSLWSASKGDLGEIYSRLEKKTTFKVGERSVTLKTADRNNIKNTLLSLEFAGMLGTKHNRDITDDLRKGYVVAFNLANGERTEASFFQAQIAVECRRLFRYDKPTLEIYDECQRVIPDKVVPSCKKEILNQVDHGRYKGKSVLFASQKLKGSAGVPSMDSSVLSSCEYILVTSRTGGSSWDKIRDEIKDITYEEEDTVRELSSEDGRVQYALIDQQKARGEKVTTFFPYISPCRVREERTK